MVKELERLGLFDSGVFHKNGKEVSVKVLALGITNNKDDPKNGNYIPAGTNAYVFGNRESPTSNKFPVIYLKIIE